MEIDSRFPTIQASQPYEPRAAASSVEPEILAESSSEFFISPVLRFDSRSLTVLFQVRDSRSGDVVRQFPAETVVERYRQDPTAKPFVLTARGADDTEDTATDTGTDEASASGPVIVGDPRSSGDGRTSRDGAPASGFTAAVAGGSQTAPVDLVA